MLKWNREERIAAVRGTLALRSEIDAAVDELYSGMKNLCWLGIGGTWASCMQAVVHMKERSAIECFAANAAEYSCTGDRRISAGTVIVFSSVTGTTKEMIGALTKAKQSGARILGFVDTADTPLSKLPDYCIAWPANEQLKFLMTADRFLFREGVMPEYEAMYAQFDRCLPEALAAAEQDADEFGRDYALKHCKDAMHYFIGEGTLYGAAYSYAMCFWEEMHWHRSKSIHAAELFHGTLEIMEKDTPVTLFLGEDLQRPLGERAARFLRSVTEDFTVIDTKACALPGIDECYRHELSPLVIRCITGRIDAHLEELSGHDTSLRRYYRKADY